MNRDQDWAIRQVWRVEIIRRLGNTETKLCRSDDVTKLLRRAQAQERAAWRKAIRKLKEESAYMQTKADEPPNLRDCWQARVAVLSDLLAAMKRREG